MERSQSNRKSGRSFMWSPSGGGPLCVAVAELRSAAKYIGKAGDSQAAAGESLLKWALSESPNAGVRDVVYQTRELLDLSQTASMLFRQELETSITALAAVKEAEKNVNRAEKEKRGTEAEEEKLRKDLKRTEKWGKGGDATLIQHRLRELALSKDSAERRINDIKAEQEVVKMFRLRSGLESLASAYVNLGTAMQEIFKGAGDVSHQLPGISTENIRDVYYHGAPLTADRVRRVRDSLGYQPQGDPKHRRRSAPPSVNRQRKIFDSASLRLIEETAALSADTGSHMPHSYSTVSMQSRCPSVSSASRLPDFHVPPPAYAPVDPNVAARPICAHCRH